MLFLEGTSQIQFKLVGDESEYEYYEDEDYYDEDEKFVEKIKKAANSNRSAGKVEKSVAEDIEVIEDIAPKKKFSAAQFAQGPKKRQEREQLRTRGGRNQKTQEPSKFNRKNFLFLKIEFILPIVTSV